MASLVGKTAHFRAATATHVPLKLVDWRRLRPAHDVESDRLMRVAAETANFQKLISGIERVAERRRRLRRSAQSQHALVPRVAAPAYRLPCGPPQRAVLRRARNCRKAGRVIWCPWKGTMRPAGDGRQAARVCELRWILAKGASVDPNCAAAGCHGRSEMSPHRWAGRDEERHCLSDYALHLSEPRAAIFPVQNVDECPHDRTPPEIYSGTIRGDSFWLASWPAENSFVG
jgi:hypothetical protein